MSVAGGGNGDHHHLQHGQAHARHSGGMVGHQTATTDNGVWKTAKSKGIASQATASLLPARNMAMSPSPPSPAPPIVRQAWHSACRMPTTATSSSSDQPDSLSSESQRPHSPGEKNIGKQYHHPRLPKTEVSHHRPVGKDHGRGQGAIDYGFPKRRKGFAGTRYDIHHWLHRPSN